MSSEGSCDVDRVARSTQTNDGRRYDWAFAYCRTCGAGSFRIEEGGLLVSFTTTGFPFENCADRGPQHATKLILTPPLPPTLSDTLERHG